MFLWRFSMFFTIFVHPSIKWSACCSLARSSAGSSASAFVTSSADETWSDFEIDCIAVRCAARLENLRIQNSYGDGENLRPSSMTQGNWWEMMKHEREVMCKSFSTGEQHWFLHMLGALGVIDMDSHGYIWVNYLVGGWATYPSEKWWS